MGVKDSLGRLLRAVRTAKKNDTSRTLPPAPQTFGSIEPGVDESEVTRDDSKRSSNSRRDKRIPLRGKSGTITGLRALCPECEHNSQHMLIGYKGTHGIVKCLECNTEHRIPFSPPKTRK